MEKREILASYSWTYNGDWGLIRRALANEETPVSFHSPDSFITVFDDSYPVCLKALKYPPWVLWYRGDITLLKKPMITVVGSRQMDDYGEKCTRLCASVLGRRYVLVSGLAKGVDACVHRTAIKTGNTIGVIGSGLSIHYPKENDDLYRRLEKTDLILSEYPYHTGVRRYHFPWRNRILAALGSAVIVTEAEEKSGTMLTVNEALDLNKEVYCFPYPYAYHMGKGCNRLIAEGANIIWDQEQLEDL